MSPKREEDPEQVDNRLNALLTFPRNMQFHKCCTKRVQTVSNRAIDPLTLLSLDTVNPCVTLSAKHLKPSFHRHGYTTCQSFSLLQSHHASIVKRVLVQLTAVLVSKRGRNAPMRNSCRTEWSEYSENLSVWIPKDASKSSTGE